MDPSELDAIAISHFHADHSADFFGLVHYLAYRSAPPQPIPVFVPPGGVAKITDFLDAGADHAMWSVVRLEEVTDEEPRSVGDMTLRFAAASHSVPTNAIRVESEGKALVFSGDTGLGGGFPDLAAAADIVISEAALTGDRDTGAYPYHLSGAEAATIARTARAGRLVLSHLAPTLPAEDIMRAAESAFDGPIDLAYPGLRVTV